MRDWAARHRWETVLGGILLATIVVNATLSPFFLGFGNFINLFWLSIALALYFAEPIRRFVERRLPSSADLASPGNPGAP